MATQGTATLDFGTIPGSQDAHVAITGQASILADSLADAWILGIPTATHNLEEHMMVPMEVKCGSIVAGTGFTIYASTEYRLTGTFTVAWVWN